MRRLTSTAFAALLVAALCETAFAQGTSSLTGTVTDPNGAVVSGATVTATNVATNISTSTQTTDAGVYRFQTLPVGNYTVKVEAAGFSTAQVEQVLLTVAQVVTRDVKLAVGSPTETVTVVAGGEQLTQPSESSVSALLSRNAWENYPLENRDTNEFINLMPGAVPDAFAGSTRGAAVNGTRGGMGNFLVEGYDNNDQGQGGRGALVPGGITSISPEAIQEYRVITNNYSAQYGKAGGFVSDTVLRSGTNDVHGSLFAYNRIQKLAANDFFSNRAGVEDSLVRNQFGGSFGGPIRKDKTFAFGTVELSRLRQGAPITTTGTTQEFINFVQSGAFATFHESNPEGLCMAFLGEACPGAFANSRRLGSVFSSLRSSQPFPLATSNFSNIGASLLTDGIVYPVPVYGDVTAINKSFSNVGRFTVKLDHTFRDEDRLTGTFLFEDSDTGDTIGGGDGFIGPPFLSPGRSMLAGITHNHTFSPTVINETKFSYLRHVRDFAQCPGTEDIPSIVTAVDPLGVAFGCTSGLPQFFTDNQFQIQNHVSFVLGNHGFKTGAEYRRIRNGSAFEATKNGFFLPHGVEEFLTDGFFGDEADLAIFGAPTFGGFFFAQASVNPQTGDRPEYYRGFRSNEWAAYFQDDWKVRSNLTFNLGLRWEYFGPPHNFRPGFDSNFYFGSADTPVPNPSSNVFFPVNEPLAAKVVRGGFQLRDHEIWAKDFNNFAPRAGFAWDIFGNQKLVLSGGGAVSYDRIWNNLFENIRFNAPLFSFATVGAFGNGIPAGPLSTPGLFASPFTPANTRGFNNPAFNPAPSPRHMDENLRTPYIQQFNLGVQYEFMRDFVFETRYIATAGRELTGLVDINTFNGRTGNIVEPGTGRVIRANGSSRRPNPAIAADNFRTNAFSSIYHGGQFQVRNRLWHGLQFAAHYTFAKSIDTVSDAFNNRSGQSPTDKFDINLDRGRTDFDVRHRFVTHFTYELPLFKGNRWLGGWVATGILSLQSGVPFSIFHGSQDPNADGSFTDRVVFTGSDLSNVYRNGSPADGFIDGSQFEGMVTRVTRLGPAAGCGPGNGVVLSDTRWWCNGTLGRNVLTGPDFKNMDFGLQKRFTIREGQTLKLMANAFNVFNHPNFGLPNRNLGSAQFGRSTNTVGTPRVIQLAIRYDF